MKRDMDIVRKIALALRDSDKMLNSVDGIEDPQFRMHAQLLIEARLAEGTASKTIHNQNFPMHVMLFRLTWAGHDFADSIDDETLWKKAKEHVIKPGASWSFGVLGEWLKMEMKTRLGIPL